MEPDNRSGDRRDPGEHLSELEFRYRSLIEQIPAITYTEITDADGSSSAYISPQVERFLGYAPSDFPDLDAWGKIIHPDDRSMALETYERSDATGEPFVVEYRVIGKDGRVVWLRDEAMVVRDAARDRRFWQGVMLDVTDEKRVQEKLREAQEQIRYLAYHDTLTGLANRALFEEMLEKGFARARRGGLGIAVIYLDLDDFKTVNDTYGHDIGDELLRQVGERLTEAVRDTDLVARQGGDEFLILLADLDLERTEDGIVGARAAREFTETVCARIETLMNDPVIVATGRIQSTFSFGVSIYPTEASDAREILKQADANMYAHKRAMKLGGPPDPGMASESG